jgi:hypothetical protein
MARTRRRSSTSANYIDGFKYGKRGNARGKATRKATGVRETRPSRKP